ncbi:MAG TPA: hypothetical protein PLW86_14970 [Rhodocyclaceae bacterium]|nr:hypothetical protein [Rhodocyclaceae bacterium]
MAKPNLGFFWGLVGVFFADARTGLRGEVAMVQLLGLGLSGERRDASLGKYATTIAVLHKTCRAQGVLARQWQGDASLSAG